MAQSRRIWTSEEKFNIIMEARKGAYTVVEVCEKYEISSSLFYRWEKKAKEGALQALASDSKQRRLSKV